MSDSDTKELFIKEEPVAKKRKPMTKEAKKALIERLAKGRKEAKERKNASAKSTKKVVVKKEPEPEPVPHSEPEPEPVPHSELESEPVPHSEPESEPEPVILKLKRKPRAKAKPKPVVKDNSEDFASLKAQLDEIKLLLKDQSISKAKKTELKEEVKEIKMEIKEAKAEPPPTKIPVPVVAGYSTFRNKKKRHRPGF